MGGRQDGTWITKCKSSQLSGGVEPACGSVSAQWVTGKQIAAELKAQISTCYSRQRTVLQIAISEDEVCFAEVPISLEAGETATKIQSGSLG